MIGYRYLPPAEEEMTEASLWGIFDCGRRDRWNRTMDNGEAPWMSPKECDNFGTSTRTSLNFVSRLLGELFTSQSHLTLIH